MFYLKLLFLRMRKKFQVYKIKKKIEWMVQPEYAQYIACDL